MYYSALNSTRLLLQLFSIADLMQSIAEIVPPGKERVRHKLGLTI
jgi:hypothetical protein